MAAAIGAAVVCLAGGIIGGGATWGLAAPAANTVTTIAGGVGGPGAARSVSIEPCGTTGFKIRCGLAFAGGRLYFTDVAARNFDVGLVRSVSIKNGALTTPAGDGLPVFVGNGVAATQSGLEREADVAFDHSGNMLISGAATVRVMAAETGTFYGQPMTKGHLYTVAGGGQSAQDGVPATTASIRPLSAVVDGAGNLVICGAGSIRVVAASSGLFYGQPMTAGDIYTVAGGGSSTEDGVLATDALLRPAGEAIGGDGNVLIADTTDGNDRIRLIATTTGTFFGQPMTAGHIYTVAGGGPSLKEKAPAIQTSMTPLGLAADKNGNVIIADWGDNLIRVVAASAGRFYGQQMKQGFIYAVAGGGTSAKRGPVATSAKLSHPVAVTTDSAGNIIVGNQAYQLHAVAARTGRFYGVQMTAGHLYAVAGNGQPWSAGFGGPAAKAQIFANDVLTFDRGNLVTFGWFPTSGSLHAKVRLMPATSGTFFGQAMKAGHIYVIAGTDKDILPRFGIRATEAPVDLVGGLAADAHGNLLIADGNFFIDVLAAHAGTFYGQRMKAGFLYKIAGDGQFQDSGDGGLATKAGMHPASMIVDAQGNIVIADTFRIRVVAARAGSFYGLAMKAGHIYAIAGNGNDVTSGDGGPAIDAQLGNEKGLARDGSHGLLVSDENQIRMIATATGTFFGVAMIKGDIYTIAGTGNQGTSPDGGPAAAADITPGLVTMDAAGNLVFYDQAANKLRVVASRTGTFFGQSMTADHLYSIVGGGDGHLASGQPGTDASIYSFVFGLATGPHGIAFTDANSIRVRLLAP